MAVQTQKKYVVGGVQLDRPFKIRRLGHFGVNINEIDRGLEFYTDVLGFKISDVLDYEDRQPGLAKEFARTKGYFMRHGADHHSYVIMPRPMRDKLAVLRGKPIPEGITVNQITWQVGNLREVADAIEYFAAAGRPIVRTGRDHPGSNWHVYLPDPDGFVNELYYGIEQIGWDGYSKPADLHGHVPELPPLPRPSEYAEVQAGLERGVSLGSGYRYEPTLPARFDVDGILMPRPFKIVRIGPIGLFVADPKAAEAFYVDLLGFRVTERTTLRGHECVFLRANTEHHSVVLMPLPLRDALDVWQEPKLAFFGLQLANYRQLRDAVSFLREHGCKVVEPPPELHRGIDAAVWVRDPDGHALELYYYMEQIGWDGRVRPAADRATLPLSEWPETIEARSDTYDGEPFPAPWE